MATDALFLANAIEEDNIGILLDTFHMNIEEASMTQTIEDSQYLLKHMHVSDNNRKMPGLGHIDFGEIINSLNKVKFDGILSFEPYLFSKDYQKELSQGVDVLTKLG
jgi:D-psicose/D-tagatose/L-ribulose 3-epimerase